MSDHYILNKDKTVTKCSLMEWATWLETDRTHFLLRDEREDGSIVSTIFIGLDMSFDPSEKHLFETAIFGENDDVLDIERFATYEEAVQAHERIKKELTEENK